jgi:hypothetical protein
MRRGELCGCRGIARGLGGTFRLPPCLAARPQTPASSRESRGLCLRRHPVLRIDPHERRCASAFLAAKTDVADEGVPADASAPEQQREREVGDPPAVAGQPQKRVALGGTIYTKSVEC